VSASSVSTSAQSFSSIPTIALSGWTDHDAHRDRVGAELTDNRPDSRDDADV
jgi:hypothetical protein